ncbi:MAG: hypothetical protein AAF170_17350 [Bacteroidota bacterium]
MSPLSFSDIADEWVGLELATRARMMGQPCLKANGSLFACAGPEDSAVVKLGATRVQEEIDAGHGIPYGPNGPRGKAFKQWVQVTHASSTYVRERLFEALEGTVSV